MRYLRHEAETGAGMEPEWLEWSFGREGDSHGALALNGSGYSVTGRVDRIDVDGSGSAVIRDYKGKTVHAGARWAQDGRLQAALYALAARELLGLEPAGALYQPIGKGDRRPRGFVAAGVARPLRQRRRRRARGARRRAAGGARRGAGGRARDEGGPDPPVPVALLAERLRLPRDLPGRRAGGGGGRVSAPRFTAEQRAAIEDRSGSALLAANAGSGKTAVMVERFVEAVLLDERPGRLDPGADVHREGGRRAARARAQAPPRPRRGRARALRRRVLDRDDPRLLRAGAARAAARRRPGPALRGARGGRRGAARRRRVRARARGVGGGARAAGGRPRGRLRRAACATSCSARTTRCAAAAPSRGCTIPAERPAPSGAALADARAVAAARAGGRRRRDPRQRGAQRARGLRAGAGRAAACRRPASWTRRSSGRARRRSPPRRARPTGRPGRPTGGPAPTTTRAPALRLLDELLRRFAAEYADGKAERAAVDFEDLELGVRDLLADDAERRRWSERFALLMVDEFQDTNRLQLDLLEALERGNLFAVGDEFQSIYRFRHADVEIFRERRAKLEAARVRGLRANFRSAPELLDVLDAAFAPVFGEAFQPLVAGRPREAGAGGGRRRRAAAVRPRPARGRAARRAARDRHEGLGRARGRARARRARRAAVAARRGALGRPPAARGGARRPPPGRRGRARARDRLAAPVRAGARGAGPAHLRRRRPRLLVPGAGPRRPRLPRRARQPARRDGLLRRARLAVLRRGQRRAGPARPGGPRGRARAVGRAARRGRRGRRGRRPAPARGSAPSRPRTATACCASRPSSPASAPAPSGSPRRRCSSARSPRRATTSRSSPARAASGGWRTCAS